MTSLSICLWCENGWKKEQCCNFDRKLKIIEDLRGGKSQHFMADLYKMPKSTVGDIWKDRDKIEHFVSTSSGMQNLMNWTRPVTHGSCNSVLRMYQSPDLC
jgi:hypothetical protein